MESSRNSRSMENLDQHVPYEPQPPQPHQGNRGPSNKSNKTSEGKPRRRDKEMEQADASSSAQARKSSANKKENRKSSGPVMNSSGSSPSRSNEKAGSGGKRRDHPTGVGAIGGRGSILHNTVNPLLTEVGHFGSIWSFWIFKKNTFLAASPIQPTSWILVVRAPWLHRRIAKRLWIGWTL